MKSLILVLALSTVAVFAGKPQAFNTSLTLSDPFVITSQQSDSPTSAAMVVTTENPWLYGWLIQATNDVYKFGVHATGTVVANSLTLGGPEICTTLNFASQNTDLFSVFPCDSSVGQFNIEPGTGNLQFQNGNLKNIIYVDNQTPEFDFGDFQKVIPSFFYGSKFQFDAGSSSEPPLKVRNNGADVLSVTPDGAIKAGSASAWKFLPASGGQLIVEVDGQKYAITATPIP